LVVKAASFAAPHHLLAPPLPPDEFLKFNSVGLREITPAQFGIQSGRGFRRQGMPVRRQVQKLIIAPLGILAGKIGKHLSLADLTRDNIQYGVVNDVLKASFKSRSISAKAILHQQ